jgi:riboflavin biosynthesis pyrimidine reductase
VPKLDAQLIAGQPPFEVLVAPPGFRVPLPDPFDALLPELRLPEPAGRAPLVANFVAGLDGTIRVSHAEPASPLVALRLPHDWILLTLLRACAATIVVGAESPRAANRLQDAAAALPALADELEKLRSWLGLGPLHHVVVSGSGQLPAHHRMWQHGATVVTTPAGAEQLRLEGDVQVVVDPAGGERVRGEVVAAAARAVTPERLPSGAPGMAYYEGGPALFAELVAASEVDELFLTVSPVLAGHAPGHLRLMEGPGYGRFELAGLARVGSHLFERWRQVSGSLTTEPLRARPQ